MDNSKATFSPTRLLLCDESETSLYEKEVDLLSSMDEEYIKSLLDRERHDFSQISSGDWIKEARLDAIQYILNKRDLLGFTSQTAYLSVIYLDRFLSRRSIDEEKYWAVRLLSMACLSLAAKMEECTVPALPEFCVEEYSFESSVIQRMELLVLNTLEWKMGSLTPFAFTQFFLTKFCQSSLQRNAMSTIVEVILGSLKDVEIMCYRSSVIAASATLVALDPRLTRDALEHKISLLSSSDVLKIEDVVSCYYQILAFDTMKLNRGDIMSPDLSPNQLQIDEVLGSSSVTTAANAKRKRLIFNQNDNISPKKRQN
ncbi:cyclin-D5-1-like [Olea europaea var. sylvestris]|uniref:cyclin-D5-1-like n=1 Tax=Olea europaea var. sylvestris TaxID=158386 RepID=UPI000C1D5695|nr:cyclin-D5-1-like [Olea europaea var. sylvestris]